MIIVVNMKNVMKQGEIYHFRLAVPADCQDVLEKKEIVESLQTKDPLEANRRAEPLRTEWKAKFKEIRDPSLATGTKKKPVKKKITFRKSVTKDSVDYYQLYHGMMMENLTALLETTSEDGLQRFVDEYCKEYVACIWNETPTCIEELNLEWPPTSKKSSRETRREKRALIEVLKELRQILIEELRLPDMIAQETPPQEVVKALPPAEKAPEGPREETDLFEVAEILIRSKTRVDETNAKIRAEVRNLKEWTSGTSDITKYTKTDLIDYIQNCLPNIPSNITQKKIYKGKSLKECVALTKKDPTTYPPIAYKTCENKLMRLQMVFNYAKDDLGVISVNPAKGVEIPAKDSEQKKPKGYTSQELKAMIRALGEVRKEAGQKPSQYWVPILCLYHGFRLNEPCSLFLKDVYEDEDGVFVIDLNDVGKGKSLKNKSSVRVVPVHPFVLNDLGFRAFVEAQKEDREKGLLFSELTLTEGRGYRRKISSWYAKWKETWLPKESLYKHTHDLRYSFIQQAQNQAKISDRCSQEITGHAVEGVSSVHLGYSGGLKPKAMLEELEKLKYGWEDAPAT